MQSIAVLQIECDISCATRQFDEPYEKTPPDLATNARKYLVSALKTKHKR